MMSTSGIKLQTRASDVRATKDSTRREIGENVSYGTSAYAVVSHVCTLFYSAIMVATNQKEVCLKRTADVLSVFSASHTP